MAGRPSKAYLQLVTEQVSHKTKEEIELRKRGEESLLTGIKMKCWYRKKDNPGAYKEFQRISNLLEKIKKNDALYESVINRYCLLKEECDDFEVKREQFYKTCIELEEAWATGESDLKFSEYLKFKNSLQQQVVKLDIQVMQKRSMLLAIEKENVMTISSAMRSIPKTPPAKKSPNDDIF